MQEQIYKGYVIVPSRDVKGVEIYPKDAKGSFSFDWFPDVRSAKEWIDNMENT